KFLAVGAIVPWAEPKVGAIATQSYANPRYGPDGLALLRQGKSAQEVVEQLTATDGGSAQRQLGVVDGRGRGATFTGDDCMAWAGGRTGPSYAAQGNILVSAETVDAPAEPFESSAGGALAERRERLTALGYAGDLASSLRTWAGRENLEERLNGIERIDPVVLAELRAQ